MVLAFIGEVHSPTRVITCRTLFRNGKGALAQGPKRVGRRGAMFGIVWVKSAKDLQTVADFFIRTVPIATTRPRP